MSDDSKAVTEDLCHQLVRGFQARRGSDDVLAATSFSVASVQLHVPGGASEQ